MTARFSGGYFITMLLSTCMGSPEEMNFAI